MEDPRIVELMEHADSVGENGEPTAIAMIARRVKAYMGEVETLRKQLNEHHASVQDLEKRRENLAARMEERKNVREDISISAQDAIVKAALSSTSTGATHRKEAAEKQQQLKQFMADYATDEKRFKEMNRALESGRARLMEARDQIGRRMNIVDALLQRAEIEWPTYFFEENARLKSAKPGDTTSARHAAPLRRGSGKRRIVRRRRAS